MCIHRKLPDGSDFTIELTDTELVDAALEYETNSDIRSCKEEVESIILMAPEDTPDSAAIKFFGRVTTIGKLKEIQADEEKMSKVASVMRNMMDDDPGLILSDYESDCRKEAFNELIDELLKDK